MKSLRAFFASRTGRLVLHDGAIALGMGYAAWDAAGHSLTWGAAVAAGIVAAKAFLRLILPVPPAPNATRGQAGYGAVELLVVVLVVLVILALVGVLR
ncbi:MAG TPA: hypothetical protein VFH54_02485 [Mycobacteriales bacterium]|nr:hypothetical protein [Mycobacteriales bacterium]